MNSIDRSQEIEEFLNYLFQIEKASPEHFNKNTIYRELMNYGLSFEDKDFYGQGIDLSNIKDNVLNYANKYLKGSTTTLWGTGFNSSYWLDVDVEKIDPNTGRNIMFDNQEFIKLYIPVKSSALEYTSEKLFTYLDQQQIPHTSKIGSTARSDGFIIRILKDDLESLNKIMNVIDSDDYIKNNLTTTNPFMPTINNIGIMNDNGESYNSQMALLTSTYIKSVDKSKDKITATDFLYWINNSNIENIINPTDYRKINETKDLLLSSINSSAIGAYEKSKNMPSVNNFFTQDNNINNMNQNIMMDNKDKNNLIIQSCKETYEKYGEKHLIQALKSAMENGDYQYFTNGDKGLFYRNNLNSFVSKDDFTNYINNVLRSVNINSQNIDELANNFTSQIFNNYQNQILDEACMATVKKNGVNQLAGAIDKFANENNPNCFTRFNDNSPINYREALTKNFNNGTIIPAIKKSMLASGCDTLSLSDKELIEMYSSNVYYILLEQEKNKGLKI